MGTGKATDHLLGSLDLLVLRCLATGESLHGYAITERIQKLSVDVLRVEEGSLYPALHRMNEAGLLVSEWGNSENNRRARFYRITKLGRRHVAELETQWGLHVEAVKRVLKHA